MCNVFIMTLGFNNTNGIVPRQRSKTRELATSTAEYYCDVNMHINCCVSAVSYTTLSNKGSAFRSCTSSFFWRQGMCPYFWHNNNDLRIQQDQWDRARAVIEGKRACDKYCGLLFRHRIMIRVCIDYIDVFVYYKLHVLLKSGCQRACNKYCGYVFRCWNKHYVIFTPRLNIHNCDSLQALLTSTRPTAAVRFVFQGWSANLQPVTNATSVRLIAVVVTTTCHARHTPTSTRPARTSQCAALRFREVFQTAIVGLSSLAAGHSSLSLSLCLSLSLSLSLYPYLFEPSSLTHTKIAFLATPWGSPGESACVGRLPSHNFNLDWRLCFVLPCCLCYTFHMLAVSFSYA